MTSMFSNATRFDQDISGWDVSNVDSFEAMFFDASSFNGDLSAWQTGSARTLKHMFLRNSRFQSDVSKWGKFVKSCSLSNFLAAHRFSPCVIKQDVSRVTNMVLTFGGTPLWNSDLSNWNVSRVTEFTGMFGAYLSDLAVLSTQLIREIAIDFSSCLYSIEGCHAFNSDISKWTTSQALAMDYMFNNVRCNVGWPWQILLLFSPVQ